MTATTAAVVARALAASSVPVAQVARAKKLARVALMRVRVAGRLLAPLLEAKAARPIELARAVSSSQALAGQPVVEQPGTTVTRKVASRSAGPRVETGLRGKEASVVRAQLHR